MFSAIRRLLRSKTALEAAEESFVVLIARVPGGVSPEAGFELRDLFNRMSPDGWWFLNPGYFEPFFASERSGLSRAAECRAMLEQLRLKHPCLADLKFGQAEGLLLVSRRANGELSSSPLGSAVAEAMRNAG